MSERIYILFTLKYWCSFIRGKLRIILCFCPMCNSDAPEMDNCPVCDRYHYSKEATWPPPEEVLAKWWNIYHQAISFNVDKAIRAAKAKIKKGAKK